MYDLKIIEKIAHDFISRSLTLAVAESVTAGHLQAALSLAENAGHFFQGGITTYTLEQKVKLLDVTEPHARACNCVSEPVTEEMGTGAHRLFDCDWAISTTGYAVQDEHNEKSYLFALYTFTHKGNTRHTQMIKAPYDDALQNQIFYTNSILHAFHRYYLAHHAQN